MLSVPGGHGVGDLTIDDGGPMADPHQAFGPAEYRWPPTDAEPTLERPHKDAYEGRFMADSCPFICNRRERCANGSARPLAVIGCRFVPLAVLEVGRTLPDAYRRLVVG